MKLLAPNLDLVHILNASRITKTGEAWEQGYSQPKVDLLLADQVMCEWRYLCEWGYMCEWCLQMWMRLHHHLHQMYYTHLHCPWQCHLLSFRHSKLPKPPPFHVHSTYAFNSCALCKMAFQDCASKLVVSEPALFFFIFLYFWWEEWEGEKTTSGHFGQLPVPRAMCKYSVLPA